MPAAALPILEIESALIAGLREHGRVVLSAPTGSGKSTQVPRMLRRHRLLDTGQVVVLQPRRLAARMLAKRVSEEEGVPLGAEVGYQIRLEKRVSAQTRIKFVTEGVLLRQMTSAPDLPGVRVLVFDEFHERHLDGDISLARAREIQATTRPDLKIIVMSATLAQAALKSYLEPCALVESDGRTYPVEMRYWPRTPNFDQEPVWELATQAVLQAVEETPGDLLVFMPGAFEIGRTVRALEERRELRDLRVLPLHGELPAERQDEAVGRSDRRKIIVSTNVAETSLTIDGVTGVIDAGLARIARFDPRRSINTLLIEKISRASAQQRAGRAGRTAPGICWRLWTERDHADRLEHEKPEVHRVDLAESVLTLKAAGITDLQSFAWFDAPDRTALAGAVTLLQDLGAIESKGEGAITLMGQRMMAFPAHPRYARMLLEADRRGCARIVALMAAMTQARPFLLRGVGRDVEKAREAQWGDDAISDFLRLAKVWEYAHQKRFDLEACRRLGIHAQSARQVGAIFRQLLQVVEGEGLNLNEAVPVAEICKCVLAGFSDQLALRLDRGTLRCAVVHGRKGMLARESVVQEARILVAAEISEIEGRCGEVNVLLSLATAVEEAWLEELFPADFETGEYVVYDEDTRRVIMRQQKRFRDLVLREKPTATEPPEEDAARLLASRVRKGEIKLKHWTEGVDRWITRVNRMAEFFPELEVSPMEDSDHELLLEQICLGSRGARELKDKPVMPVLEDWLRPEQLAVMDDYVPERVELPGGRRARIRYGDSGRPILSARLQDLIGLTDAFKIGVGKLSVQWEILAPNQRPVQLTDSLDGFWTGAYGEVRKQLAGRYPKHHWPPATG
ncbi:ATP-dependent helicase HrpB [Opitutaceae bacterium]|nr:ATP-dependent helicase HrpB [Opitutaceae bacterium]